MSTPQPTLLVISNSHQQAMDYKAQLLQGELSAYQVLIETIAPDCVDPSPTQQIDGLFDVLIDGQLNGQIDGILLDCQSSPDQPDHFKVEQFWQPLWSGLTERFTTQGRQCPPLVVIGDDNVHLAVWAFKQGAVDYLVRGQFSAGDLRATLGNAMQPMGRTVGKTGGKPVDRTVGSNAIAPAPNGEFLELSQSRTQLRRVLDSLFSFVGMLTPDGILLEVNRTALNAAALQPAEVLGKPFEQTYWWAYDPAVQAQLRDAIGRAANGEIMRYDVTVRLGDARYVIIDFALVPLQDETGRVEYLIPSGIDITDRKQVEASLRESQQHLQRQLAEIESIYQSAPIGLTVLDQELRFVRINQRLADINGLPIEAHLERTVREVLPDLADAAEQLLRPVLETGEPLLNVEIQGETPAQPGIKRTWLEHFLPLKHGDRMIGVSIVCEEITNRRRVEEELRQSEERYRTLFESMEDGFCVIEMLFDDHNQPVDYRFVEINPAFARQTGLQNAEGKTARQLLPDLEEHWFDIYGSVALTGKPLRFENGSEVMNRWFDVYVFHIGPPDSRRVALLFKDISDRKSVEIQQERLLHQEQVARREAERANRIKDEFLAILSHELRSPLNPILGWARLLQTRKLSAEQTADALATIERNAKLQTQLVDDLLDIARILRGKLKLENQPVNLAEVIEAAIETVSTAAAAKSIQVQFALGTGFQDAPLPPLQISGDAARIQQIIWNLLTNAIKFTPNGGQVYVWLEQVEGQAQILVQDTGKGISSEFLPHLFESFRQEDVSITRQHGGLGLGLSIVRYLVEAHGGRITADSPGEGMGATFTVWLPLLQASPAIRMSDRPTAADPDLSGIRILAVDDAADTRELLTALLTQYGAEVTTVANGKDALRALQSFQPNILISDIGMPDMDGYALLHQIRSLSPNRGGQIPAIALTAYVRDEDAQRAFQYGYQCHLPKPIDIEQLVQSVLTLASPRK